MRGVDAHGVHSATEAGAAVQEAVLGNRPAWLLQTASSAMLLHLPSDDVLLLPYWGARGRGAAAHDYLLHPQGNRPSQRDFLDGQPLAYPMYGDPLFKEVCLVVARADGFRDTRVCFTTDQVTDSSLDLQFRDDMTGLVVTHHFRVFTHEDVILRWVTLTNSGRESLTLERALSAALPLPPAEYDAWSLHGQWGREFEVHHRPVSAGKFVIESRRGKSSHEAHPWFAIRPRDTLAEHTGDVWFGSLAWSGNWFCSIEVEPNDALHIVAGIQPFDFAWRLAPGETFVTPELACGYSAEGLGGAARALHAFEEHAWIPETHRQQPRPVLYNSWEATNFDVSAQHQMALAQRAAELGIELFVVDDGWFGARDNDRAGLGDWTVNSRKFPNGLRELVDEVHRLGMQFGIWVEPEMVNPDSDLFRAHPDWAYHIDGRTPTYGRNQLVLNFARADVRDYISGQLRRLLTDHGRIEFVKWDHNRDWTEVGWPEDPERQREVWVRHVRGVYEVLHRLRDEFPHVLFESCAGGGGRADLGILRWADQVWTSDNTDAADRLSIQYGYSRAHSPRVMVNWVTDVPNQQTGRVAPLSFRFHVAMQGVLGIGGDISQWSSSELEEARRFIAEYKRLRPLVQFGRQYWLMPPRSVGPCAVQYVSSSGDEAAVFLYQVRGLRGSGVRRVRLHGLLASRRYRRDSDGAETTGAVLMQSGIPAETVDPRSGQPVLDWRSRIDVWRAI